MTDVRISKQLLKDRKAEYDRYLRPSSARIERPLYNAPADNWPPISVVLATRNRSASVGRTVRSILSNDYAHFELIVIDQSADHLTQSTLRAYLSDPRLRYIPTSTIGLQVARNLAAGAAQNEIIVTTDDDCEVPVNWLTQFAAAFAVDRRIAIVFGSIVAGPCDARAGFIPSYSVSESLLVRSILRRHRLEGMGACFGFKKSAWVALGGFDPTLGVGAPFRSAGETDFALRALLSGHFVYGTPAINVVHYGFRTWEECEALVYRYLYGVGAVYVKHLRNGRWAILGDFFPVAWRFVVGGRAVHLGNRSHGRLKLKGFLAGAAAGWRAPLDKRTGHFRSPVSTIEEK